MDWIRPSSWRDQRVLATNSGPAETFLFPTMYIHNIVYIFIQYIDIEKCSPPLRRNSNVINRVENAECSQPSVLIPKAPFYLFHDEMEVRCFKKNLLLHGPKQISNILVYFFSSSFPKWGYWFQINIPDVTYFDSFLIGHIIYTHFFQNLIPNFTNDTQKEFFNKNSDKFR